MSEEGSKVDTWRQDICHNEAEPLWKRLNWSHSEDPPPKPSSFLRETAHQEVDSSLQEDSAVVSALQSAGGAERKPSLGNTGNGRLAKNNIPFADLLLPVAQTVRRRINESVGDGDQRFHGEAWTALERALLERLASILGNPLNAEFAAKRAAACQFGTGTTESDVDNPLYREFVASKKNDGLQSFFDTYPVAKRLCTQITDYWVEATSEFLRRLAEDRSALEDTFNDGGPLGDVVDLDADVADPHDEGRNVIIVEFECGTKVVYKPRPIPVEAFYNRFLDWLESRDAMHSLRMLSLVGRPTHGWVEFAEHQPCGNDEAVTRFYQRCGMLLCIAYVFNGTDFHRENFIANGEQPVLIDMEGLLRPHFDLEERLPTQDLVPQSAKHRFNASVLNTRMVPMLKTKNGRAVDTSSLGSEHRPQLEIREWANVNQDDMRPHKHAVVTDERCKDVLYTDDGEPTHAGEHLDEIVDGFKHTYEVLRDHRDELLGPDGLLSEAKGTSVRFILRDTSLYSTLLERCLHPKYLRDEVDRFIQLDVLSRPLLSLDERPKIWPAVAAERKALNRMDVPLFEAQADSRALTLPSGETIPDCFSRSAYEEVCHRLRSLDRDDLSFQTTAIREVFRVKEARGLRADAPGDSASSSASQPATTNTDDAPTPDGVDSLREDAERVARRVADDLLERSVQDSEDTLSWLGARYRTPSRRHDVGPARMNLFDGYSGTALLFAALAQVTGEAAYEEHALAALRPLRSRLSELEKAVTLRKSVNIGGGTGLGSVVAALTRASDLLDDPALLDDARDVASLLDPEALDHNGVYDVTSGAAGAVLGFLTLHEATGNDRVLDAAAEWGHFLLDERTEDAETGHRVWPSGQERGVETGFAHGQAGIACALWRLGEATAASRYVEAATKAAAHERHVLGADLEGALDDEPTAAWSHGATGIGISRLAGAAGTDDAPVRSDLDAALRHAEAHLLDGADPLCCGGAGRISLLVGAGRALGRPDLREAGQKGAARLCSRIRRRGTCRPAWSRDVFDTGFFQGSAGVAYTLLRVAWPQSIPTVPLAA